jgi:hypothetical protein
MNERDIFHAAVEIADPGERSAYLEKVCAANASLKRQVEGMLEVYPDLGAFLESPAVDLASAATAPVAAAEAMRRILVDRARHKQTRKAGGGRRRLDLDDIEPALEEEKGDRLLALDEALRQLEAEDLRKAELVKLRFFAGFTALQAASALGVSTSTAEKDWAYARSWLRVAINHMSGHRP